MSVLSKLPDLPQGPLGRALAGDGLTPATATELERAAAAASKGKAPVHPFTIAGSSAALPSGLPPGFPGLRNVSQASTSGTSVEGHASGSGHRNILAADRGMFNETLKAQMSLQDLILLPQRIFVFVITYTRHIASISETVLSPKFGVDDLEKLLIENFATISGVTTVVVLASFALAWGSFFLGIFAFAICLAAIPLFWTAVLVLWLEVLGVQFIRGQK